MEEEIKKEENDITEDSREENESISDVKEEKTRNDIEEDSREETEFIEDLKKQIQELVIENAQLRKERDEAHKAFLSSSKTYEEEEKTFDKMRGDIR